MTQSSPGKIRVGRARVTYMDPDVGTKELDGLVREDEFRQLVYQLTEYRIPAQRGGKQRKRRATFKLPRYRRQTGGRPGLTPLGVTTMHFADIAKVELVGTFEMDDNVS